MSKMIFNLGRTSSIAAGILATALLLLPLTANSLPDDARQPIMGDADSFFTTEDGIDVFLGTAEKPATISQGSIVISGEEIQIERSNSAVSKITARGNPARFQQQPASDQALVHGSGKTLVFNNATQILSADEAAEFVQAGNTFSGFHIEYNLTTKSVNAAGKNADERVNILIEASPEP